MAGERVEEVDAVGARVGGVVGEVEDGAGEVKVEGERWWGYSWGGEGVGRKV